MKPLLVIGDALLDRDVGGRVERLSPDAGVPVLDEHETLTRPGGAGLAAVLGAAEGRHVTLLTALGQDPAGRELARVLGAHGVDVLDLGLSGPTPQKLRLHSQEKALLRLDRGGSPPRIGPMTGAARAAVGWAEGVLVADYGRGMSAHPTVRELLAGAARDRRLVWDPHPRGARPIPQAALVTPNRAEARELVPGAPSELCAEILARRWRAGGVAVTCGPAGALLHDSESSRTHRVPAPTVLSGDLCGAGDCFAVTAAGALADGRDPLEAIRLAVERAGSFIAAGGAGAWGCAGAASIPAPSRAAKAASDAEHRSHAERVSEEMWARGGTVVASGGCFDLLHAGHIRTLEAARRLGDCLVVCLNSDASVRRLKGSGRPLVAQEDRAAVLAALACVDAVRIFEEDTPARALSELRPHIWAKGGDYSPEDLPERTVLEQWGGVTMTLPYLDGHSTTELLEEVAGRGTG